MIGGESIDTPRKTKCIEIDGVRLFHPQRRTRDIQTANANYFRTRSQRKQIHTRLRVVEANIIATVKALITMLSWSTHYRAPTGRD